MRLTFDRFLTPFGIECNLPNIERKKGHLVYNGSPNHSLTEVRTENAFDSTRELTENNTALHFFLHNALNLLLYNFGSRVCR